MAVNCSLLLLVCTVAVAASNTTLSPSTLKCRRCHNAIDLNDCTAEEVCGPNEDCYMEQVVSGHLSVVYNGGCRASDVCRSSSSSVVGKRDQTIACSRCCGGSNGCNVHLCGIPMPNNRNLQCYSCNPSQSTQSGVRKPSDCVTLDTCASDEMCYSATVSSGIPEYQYGCMKSAVCSILMRTVFHEFERCYNNTDRSCGGIPDTRATAICHSCCADSWCNYGTCNDINDRLYLLYRDGKLDLATLRRIP